MRCSSRCCRSTGPLPTPSCTTTRALTGRLFVDGDDLAERATAALNGASLRVLFEGTGDPAELAKLVGPVEENGSVVAFAAATGQAPASTSSTGSAIRRANGSRRSTASLPSSSARA